MRNLLGAGLLLLPSLFACSEPQVESSTRETSEMIERVPGSALLSPHAKASAHYLTVRSINTLESVGALSEMEARVAKRADGIIATQPSDGRISVRELLQLEAPGFIETLYPEERAALPALWALLETTNESPKVVEEVVEIPMSSVDDVMDVSVRPSSLVVPTSLALSSLSPTQQAAARRLQLSKNHDGDAATVSKTDIEAALASPGPYTPAEKTELEAILPLYLERAVSACSARARVAAPFESLRRLPAFGGVEVKEVRSLKYEETRSSSYDNPRLELMARRYQWVSLDGLPDGGNVVLLHEGNDGEIVVDAAGKLEDPGGVFTAEIWVAGRRTGSYRVKLPPLSSYKADINLSRFGGYRLFAGEQELERHLIGAGVDRARYSFEVGAPASPVPPIPELLRFAAPSLAPGRYDIELGELGTAKLDVFPEGVMSLELPTGERKYLAVTGRRESARYSVTAGYSAPHLAFLFDSATGRAWATETPGPEYEADEGFGRLRFHGVLTSSMRRSTF